MAKYLLIRHQDGEGCDDSIGCGVAVDAYDAGGRVMAPNLQRYADTLAVFVRRRAEGCSFDDEAPILEALDAAWDAMAPAEREVARDLPRYVHDCDACAYLGRHAAHDLYACPRGVLGTSVVARFGDGGRDCASTPVADAEGAMLLPPALAEALARWRARAGAAGPAPAWVPLGDWARAHGVPDVGPQVLERLRVYLSSPLTPAANETMAAEVLATLRQAVRDGVLAASELPRVRLMHGPTGEMAVLCSRTPVPAWRRRHAGQGG